MFGCVLDETYSTGTAIVKVFDNSTSPFGNQGEESPGEGFRGLRRRRLLDSKEEEKGGGRREPPPGPSLPAFSFRSARRFLSIPEGRTDVTRDNCTHERARRDTEHGERRQCRRPREGSKRRKT